jgi:integrase
VYLGVYNSAESRAEYARIIAEQAVAPSPGISVSVSRPTIDQILVLHHEFAKQHYRRPDGSVTDQVAEFTNAGKPLHKLYGHTPAADFGPLALETIRRAYIDAGNCRTLINNRIGKIKRIFKWAVSKQLIPVTTYTALTTVAGLEQGRTDARESVPVGPVDDALVDATLPHLNRHVAGLIQFQRFTGCRPGEATALRRSDIDMSGDVWFFKPLQHKTRHKRKSRVIAIGPKAQALLKEFFTDNPADYLFSPRLAAEEFRAERKVNRKTPLYPSHMKHNAERREPNPKRRPAARYTRLAYLNAITRACDRAFPPPAELAPKKKANGKMESRREWWERLSKEERDAVKKWRKEHHWHPNQLRHATATLIRKEYGLEAAQASLGHARADVTEIYAQKNVSLAAKVANERG